MYAAGKVSIVAVIGFGTIGVGIVQNFAEGGMAVRAVDQTPEALAKGMAQLASSLQTGVEAGLIADPAAVLAQVTPFLWADFDAATAGAHVTIAGSNQGKLDALAAELGSNVTTIAQHPSDEAAVDRIIAAACADGRGLDGVIAASGTAAIGPATEMSVEI